jgi:hypothetical protein
MSFRCAYYLFTRGIFTATVKHATALESQTTSDNDVYLISLKIKNKFLHLESEYRCFHICHPGIVI